MKLKFQPERWVKRQLDDASGGVFAIEKGDKPGHPDDIVAWVEFSAQGSVNPKEWEEKVLTGCLIADAPVLLELVALGASLREAQKYYQLDRNWRTFQQMTDAEKAYDEALAPILADWKSEGQPPPEAKP